ncbi:hypothetical protein SNK03_013203 [Fusarium graminearum]
MDSASVYDSLPLDRAQKEIRFIEILETSPQLRCRLSKASLLHDTVFFALSYVWGASKESQDIVVNDVTFSVTKSLADALTNVCVHWEEFFSTRSREDIFSNQDREESFPHIWADALCINQADNAEKGYQVPLMKDIYSSAQITFCSLDAISPRSNIPAAIDLIREIASRLDRRHPDNGPETAASILENLPARRFYNKAGHERWQAKNHQREADQVNIINDFSELQYWERAWIVQELVVSRQVVVYYEKSSISLEPFARVVHWVSNLVTELHAPTSLPQRALPHEQLMIANSLNKFGTINKIRTLRKLYHCTCPQVHDMRLLWVEGASFRATNPKDHVYALCGIANLDIPPRYDESVSVAEVYIEFCVEQTKIPIFAPLNFLTYAGLANGDPAKFDLPTWVPNFPDCAEAFGVPIHISLPHVRKAKIWKDCIGSVEDISIRDRSLHTTLLHIDCISDISPTLGTDEDIPGFLPYLYKMLNDAFEATESPYRKDSHPFLKLASAFYHARIPNKVWNTIELIRVARMFLYLHLSVLISEGKNKYDESYWEGFPKNICCDLERYLEVGDLEDEPYFRFFVRIISDKSFDGVDWPRNAFGDVNHFSRGVRVARTLGNEFALVPPQAEAGDEIVLLTGCYSLPLIRKVEEHYIYIGRVGFAEEIVGKKLVEYKEGQAKLEHVELQ